LSSVSVREEELDGNHLVLSGQLVVEDNTISVKTLIDTGASGFAFIDEDFTRRHNIKTLTLKNPRHLEVIDGRPIQSGAITQIAHLELKINGHVEKSPFFVTKLGHYPIVLGIPWMQYHDVAIRFSSNTVTFDSPRCKKSCLPSPAPAVTTGLTPPSIHIIGAAAFLRNSKKPGTTTAALSLYEIKNALGETKNENNWKEKVPQEFHEFFQMFDEELSKNLPPRRPYDHTIPLKDNKEPPFGALYGMSQEELKALKEYIEDNMTKGFIQASSSPAGAPVLFVKKADGSLRLCVDYRGLNEVTIKNRYPLPLIRETLDRLAKAKWYTKLDLRWGYNQIRIAKGEEWKTAFRTRYGLFEYTVMPFGLTNAPATFQHFINDTLREYLDVFCTAYLDDILIYSDTLEEHKGHVRQVLEALQRAGILLRAEKCEFFTQKTTYIGLIVSPGGISMDPKKTTAIKDWKSPKCVKDVQAFLGFANFYRRFIQGFSALAAPLSALTRKDTPFLWTEKTEAAFQALKQAFTTAPILHHFDPEKPIIVETDASDYVSAGILSQYDEEGRLHPVAFFSKKHSPAECNYEIYDKELLAIIRTFEEWRPELEGAAHPISVISDHKNLEYFMTTKQLNRRQVRWAEYLSRFNFVITYRPGKQGGKPDALTRRSGDLPEEGDERLAHQAQVVLKKENIDSKLGLFAASFSNEAGVLDDSLENLFKKGYMADKFPNEVLQGLRNGQKQSSDITLAECSERSGQLYYREKKFVPNHPPLQLRIIQEYHDTPSAGHPGRDKTFELIARDYYWPKMRETIAQYVRNCFECRRSKPTHHAPYGILRPLPIPTRPWEELSMDFVTGLPLSEGFDAVMVIVDRLTKQRHLIPCHTTANAKDVADIYLREVWKHHGLPSHITSDRGTQFTAAFWKHLCAVLRIEARMSTAYHPQTDGQTERFNAVMEQYLRTFVSYQQDDWVRWLPMAEFAANNQTSAATGVSPFFANKGYHPRMNFHSPTPQGPQEMDAEAMAQRMEELFKHLTVEMKVAQDRYETSANKSRTPAPNFQIGDEAFLSAKYIRTTRNARKLDWKWMGPYKVKKVVSPYAYELELPVSMELHPVFHVSRLELAPSDPLPGQKSKPPPPVEVKGMTEYAIEDILDSRLYRRKPQYLVQWVGYPNASWEPAEYHHETSAVTAYHERYPTKPGPWFDEDGGKL
jgi:transposase InsO family protein